MILATIEPCLSNSCLLIHAYKLLSVIIAKRLHIELEPILPDSQAGFRPARGTRDNVCILKWTINMILRESREAVITFIDYSAAFDTESQIFLDEALGSAAVSFKLRRVIQAVFRVASGAVRINNPDGTTEHSKPFNISRGVLQCDIFSPVAFIAGLWRIFACHDKPNAGITVGNAPHQVTISNLEYADDAGFLDENTEEASQRVTSISIGSKRAAAMVIPTTKTKTMQIHKKVRVTATTEAEITALKLKHICSDCKRGFTTACGLSINKGRWCDKGKTIRSRKGSLADKAVKREKRKKKEKERHHVKVEDEEIENVHCFEYLGSRLQCDGDDKADVKYRMEIAQPVFSSLSHIWKDHRLSLAMKLRLYKSSVCCTFTHACEAWDLTNEIKRLINGLNSRCLHVITGKDYRETATNPDFNLVLAIRQRRLRYLGHILRMNSRRLVRRTLVAYIHGGVGVPSGSLMEDCGEMRLEELICLARDRKRWNTKVNALK